MSKFGKITRLEVHGHNGIGVYKVGEREYFSKRIIAEIKDVSIEFESSLHAMYDILDENGNAIARFENGTYATWFDNE